MRQLTKKDKPANWNEAQASLVRHYNQLGKPKTMKLLKKLEVTKLSALSEQGLSKFIDMADSEVEADLALERAAYDTPERLFRALRNGHISFSQAQKWVEERIK